MKYSVNVHESFLHCQSYKIIIYQSRFYFISKLQSLYSRAVSINRGFSLGKKYIYIYQFSKINFCFQKKKIRNHQLSFWNFNFHLVLNIENAGVGLSKYLNFFYDFRNKIVSKDYINIQMSKWGGDHICNYCWHQVEM